MMYLSALVEQLQAALDTDADRPVDVVVVRPDRRVLKPTAIFVNDDGHLQITVE